MGKNNDEERDAQLELRVRSLVESILVRMDEGEGNTWSVKFFSEGDEEIGVMVFRGFRSHKIVDMLLEEVAPQTDLPSSEEKAVKQRFVVLKGGKAG